MKKIILIILLVTLTVMLMGCGQEEVEVFDTTQVREIILEMIDSFGDPEYEDTTWDHNSQNMVVRGNAQMVIAERDDSINLLLAESGRVAMLELVLDPANSRQEVLVWNLMITYTNLNKQIYIHLDYYHFGKLFTPNFKAERIQQSFHSFATDISYLTIEDIEAILIYLGYDEIEWEDS